MNGKWKWKWNSDQINSDDSVNIKSLVSLWESAGPSGDLTQNRIQRSLSLSLKCLCISQWSTWNVALVLINTPIIVYHNGRTAGEEGKKAFTKQILSCNKEISVSSLIKLDEQHQLKSDFGKLLEPAASWCVCVCVCGTRLKWMNEKPTTQPSLPIKSRMLSHLYWNKSGECRNRLKSRTKRNEMRTEWAWERNE